jgi:hypothetical protein
VLKKWTTYKHVYVRLFHKSQLAVCKKALKIFFAQNMDKLKPMATCEWQRAQFCKNFQNFCNFQKHGEIHFQKQAAFLSFTRKSRA